MWDLLEKAMATHSSTLAWKVPWTEEPGRIESMGLQRVRHDWTISLSLSSYLGPVFCVFHILKSLGAHHRQWLQSDGCWLQVFFSFLSALEGWKPCWLWHPCLLIWPKVFQVLLSFIKREATIISELEYCSPSWVAQMLIRVSSW